MVRARLATLALMGSLVFCSGCFPLLRHWWCHRPHLRSDCCSYDNPCGTEVAHLEGPAMGGPVMPFTGPAPSPLPLPTELTPMPPPGGVAAPPRVVPIPQASPMPYTPTKIFTPTRRLRR